MGREALRRFGPARGDDNRGSSVMAELTIDASEITAALERHVQEYDPGIATEQIGRIVEVGDGIARVSGLPGAAVNELLGVRGRNAGAGPQPRRGHHRRRGARRGRRPRRGADGQGDRPHPDRSGGRRAAGPRGRTRWASPSTARARSTPPRRDAWRCRRPASSVVSP